MTVRPFPSLRIHAHDLVPQGAFAEAQAAFLRPDPEVVAALDSLLREKNAGVVAHFYMDPELQGTLSACSWPHIHVSDSLVMADRGVAMADAGVANVFVLGVDFMSENVRAMLDAAGHTAVPVYRVGEQAIGCSLAEAAETDAYARYLEESAQRSSPLHVVYINTSLITKARAHAIIPTITCTSSNVLQTILQAAAQVDDVNIAFGPDTYMGENIDNMLRVLGESDEATVRALHPAHTPESIRSLRERFRYFREGNCIVHHMFGHDVVRMVTEFYSDAYVAAHLEVPGEMFSIGLRAQQRNAGVVGSTSNILNFILGKVNDAIARKEPTAIRVVLGTEAGMITAIVRQVQAKLRENAERHGADIHVEIVFPVASEAIAQTDDELGVVPGVAAGEGCSTAGGCATCPYMKMNSLGALVSLLRRIGVDTPRTLLPFEPRKYSELVQGKTAAQLGSEPILHMRGFQRTGTLPDALIDDVCGRSALQSA